MNKLTKSAIAIIALIPLLVYSSDYLKIERVIDGDTIELTNGEKVRLIGVDTPEKYHPLKPVQFYAEEASQFTKRMVEGKSVHLEYDLQKHDKYNRTLAYVYILPDSIFLNKEIIRQGYGFAYTKYPYKYLDEFIAIEQEARKNNVGLWADSGFNEVSWLFDHDRKKIEIFDMANNLWGVKLDTFVKPRLSNEQLYSLLDSLRVWIYELNDVDLELKLKDKGWKVLK